MEENLLINTSYLNNYRVFCFSDIYITKYSGEPKIIKYEIGDFLPTSNYNYIYGSTLLVLDYINKVIHVIINNRYYEMVKVVNNELQITTDSFLYKLIFGNRPFKAIDIYGNFLKIKNIEDLVMAIMTYPQVELYLTGNKYLKQSDVKEGYSNILLGEINYTENENICYINGEYKYNEKEKEKMLIASFNVKNTLQFKSREMYMNNWVDENILLNLVNELLINIRLLYLIKKHNILKPFTYYCNTYKYFTHIDRIKNLIRDFINNNECDFIESILEAIFLYAEFEEEYEDFIISIISEYAEIKIV